MYASQRLPCWPMEPSPRPRAFRVRLGSFSTFGSLVLVELFTTDAPLWLLVTCSVAFFCHVSTARASRPPTDHRATPETHTPYKTSPVSADPSGFPPIPY